MHSYALDKQAPYHSQGGTITNKHVIQAATAFKRKKPSSME